LLLRGLFRFNPKSDVGGDEMAHDAEPIRLEEELAGSIDPASSDERLSRPADCVRSPRSTSVFGFKQESREAGNESGNQKIRN